MLTNERTDPPEHAPATRRDMLKYMDRFGRWARKLNDEDLSMVVAFCANVQMAWTDGQKPAATAAEAVAQGTALPGLGAPIGQVVAEGSQGMCEVTLPEGASVTIQEGFDDDSAN